jgi:hypothetical protein
MFVLFVACLMVFNATFNNISVISWQSFIFWRRKAEFPEKTTDLSKVTDILSSDFVLPFKYAMKGMSWPLTYCSWIYNYLCHQCLSPIRPGFAPGFVSDKKGCTRLAAASDKVYQLHAHGRVETNKIKKYEENKTTQLASYEYFMKKSLKIPRSNKSKNRRCNSQSKQGKRTNWVRVFHLKHLDFHKHLDKANVIVITVHSFLRIVCTVGSLSSIVLLYLSRITVYHYPFGIFKLLEGPCGSMS